ncbi:unnamed protein product [Pleuronectes platessa]|uniref:Uncharacterized protein n=1 Tax=Pleuronectes platessa TaxID=8262 RepID=A0A9N7YUC0_PLEPL|nr:unnamed protein product [Pleuronectes platessa]
MAVDGLSHSFGTPAGPHFPNNPSPRPGDPTLTVQPTAEVTEPLEKVEPRSLETLQASPKENCPCRLLVILHFIAAATGTRLHSDSASFTLLRSPTSTPFVQTKPSRRALRTGGVASRYSDPSELS